MDKDNIDKNDVGCGQWKPSSMLLAGNGSLRPRWLRVMEAIAHINCNGLAIARVACGRWLPLPTLVSDKKEIKGSQSGHWVLFTWALSLPFSWAMVFIAGKQHGLWKPDNANDGSIIGNQHGKCLPSLATNTIAHN